MAATNAGSLCSLIKLPDDALAAISRHLTITEQLLLGRMVLQQGSKAAAAESGATTASGTEVVYNATAPSCKLLRGLRAAAASAVLLHITACTVKLPHSSSLARLAALPNLANMTLLVQQNRSTDAGRYTTTAVASLAQLPALRSLKIVRPQPLNYLHLTVDLAAAIGSLQRLQHLTLSGVVIPASDSASAAACAKCIASLARMTFLQAPALLSLEGPAATALLEGLLGRSSGSSRSSREIGQAKGSGCYCSNSSSCLQVLDLSGNQHMFAAYAVPAVCAEVNSSSSSQVGARQAVQHSLAALVDGGCLQELLLADTGMTQDDLAAISCSSGKDYERSTKVDSTTSSSCRSGSGSSSGQQLQRLDVHNNRLLARGDPLNVGKCLQHLQGLQHLSISWITLGPEGVAFASRLAGLRMLVMSGTRAGPAAITALHRARPGLNCLELFDSLDSSAGW